MKKRVFITLAFLLFSNQFIIAQNIPFEIKKSKEFEDDFNKSTLVLAENEGDDILMVRSYSGVGISPNDGFYIERYDSNLVLKNSFDFSMKHPRFQKHNITIGVFSYEKNINIIEFYYDLNEKSFICAANTISEDFKASKKELFRITKEEMIKMGQFSLEKIFFNRRAKMWDNDNSGDINSEGDSKPWQISFTNKQEMSKPVSGSDIVMIVNETKTGFAIALNFNDNKEYIKLYSFDGALNKKLDTKFSPELNDNKHFIKNIQVSTDASSVYLLGKAYNNEKKEGGKYLFELSKITSESVTSQLIDSQQHYVGSSKMFLKNGLLICIGFYSDLSDYKYKGISYFKLDPNTLNILVAKYNSFTEQFIIDKYGEKKDKELENLVIKNISFTKNNDIFFNAEEQYITSRGGNYSPYGGGGGGQTVYVYDDIISAKLNIDGNLIWARNINKSQFNTDAEESFVSYTSIFKDNSMFLFINAPEKIKKIKKDRIEFGSVGKNKSNLNVIRINQDGDYDYEEILNYENSPVPFMVSKGAVINNSTFFMGRKGSNKQLIKITL